MCHRLAEELNDLRKFHSDFTNIAQKHLTEVPTIVTHSKLISKTVFKPLFNLSESPKRVDIRTPFLARNKIMRDGNIRFDLTKAKLKPLEIMKRNRRALTPIIMGESTNEISEKQNDNRSLRKIKGHKKFNSTMAVNTFRPVNTTFKKTLPSILHSNGYVRPELN